MHLNICRADFVLCQNAANQDIDKAPGLMSKNPLVKFFQIGNTLITQLKQRATKTIESCRICPPTLGEIPKTIIELKPILCYNAYESDFLESLDSKLRNSYPRQTIGHFLYLEVFRSNLKVVRSNSQVVPKTWKWFRTTSEVVRNTLEWSATTYKWVGAN